MEKEEKKRPGLGGEAVKLTISKVITLVISMITGMLLVRYRTLNEYGTYSAILLVINLFTALLMLGLPNSINYFLARAENSRDKRHFLSVYYTLNSILCVIIGLILVLSIPLIERYFNNSSIGKFFYFLALYPWASTIIASLDHVLIVYNKSSIIVVYKVIYSIVMLLSVLVVQWLDLGFSAYMLIFLMANVAFCISVLLICSSISGGIKVSFDRTLVRAILTFSIPIGLSTLVGTLSAEIDKLLIGGMMDTAQLAVYSNAAKELPLTIASASISAVLFPRVAVLVKDKKTEEAVELWGNATVLSFIIISLIVAGVFVYAEDIMTLLYSAKYLSGMPVFRIYTLVMLIRCTYFGMILNSLGQTKKILFCSIANLVLNAVLNPLFYYIFGMIGPALATFVSMFLIMFLMLYMTSRASNVSYAKVFPWKRIAIILLINIPFSVLFWYIKTVLSLDAYIGSFCESIILGAIWAAFYYMILRKQIKYYWKILNC